MIGHGARQTCVGTGTSASGGMGGGRLDSAGELTANAAQGIAGSVLEVDAARQTEADLR